MKQPTQVMMKKATPTHTTVSNKKKAPPQVTDMINFERDMLNMVESIEFRQVSSS